MSQSSKSESKRRTRAITTIIKVVEKDYNKKPYKLYIK